MTYDPGADAAARYPDVTVRHRHLRGAREFVCPRRRVVLIERDMPRAERWWALAHALAHLDLGHGSSAHAVLTAREEQAADRMAARRLVDLEDLIAAALVVGPDIEAVAEELDVADDALRVRLATLHPAERGELNRRLAQKEAAA